MGGRYDDEEIFAEKRFHQELIGGAFAALGEHTEAALKSEEMRPSRDRHGRRISKPFGQGQEPEEPRRSAAGYRLNKPTDEAMRKRTGR